MTEKGRQTKIGLITRHTATAGLVSPEKRKDLSQSITKEKGINQALSFFIFFLTGCAGGRAGRACSS
jgi:hypothetical protein